MYDVDIAFDTGISAPLDEEKMCAVVRAVLVREGITRPCLLSLSIVTDERMRALNKQWRDVDSPTDVLSLECERPDDPSLAEGEPCELGDVVLAPAYIARQAQQVGTSQADEFTLLLIHGILHLLGYDHLEDADAQEMERREDELLAMLSRAPVGHVSTTRHDAEGAL